MPASPKDSRVEVETLREGVADSCPTRLALPPAGVDWRRTCGSALEVFCVSVIRYGPGCCRDAVRAGFVVGNIFSSRLWSVFVYSFLKRANSVQSVIRPI